MALDTQWFKCSIWRRYYVPVLRLTWSATLTGSRSRPQTDSGGPLVALQDGVWWLMGHSVLGGHCAAHDNLGVYGNASFFRDWIQQQMLVSLMIMAMNQDYNKLLMTATTFHICFVCRSIKTCDGSKRLRENLKKLHLIFEKIQKIFCKFMYKLLPINKSTFIHWTLNILRHNCNAVPPFTTRCHLATAFSFHSTFWPQENIYLFIHSLKSIYISFGLVTWCFSFSIQTQTFILDHFFKKKKPKKQTRWQKNRTHEIKTVKFLFQTNKMFVPGTNVLLFTSVLFSVR